MISTLGNKKFKYKICKKEIETYNFKVHMENVHKGLKKYKGDEFHTEHWMKGIYCSCSWKKDSIVINVAKIWLQPTGCNSLQKIFHKSHLQIGIGITHKSQYRLRSIIACKKNKCVVAISKQMCKQLACTQWNQF